MNEQVEEKGVTFEKRWDK